MFRQHAHRHQHQHNHLTPHQREELAYQFRWHFNHIVNQHILGHAPQEAALGQLTDETILCRCRQVSVAQIKQAIQDGATTVQQVIAQTGLGQGCTHCLETARPIIGQLLEEKTNGQ